MIALEDLNLKNERIKNQASTSLVKPLPQVSTAAASPLALVLPSFRDVFKEENKVINYQSRSWRGKVDLLGNGPDFFSHNSSYNVFLKLSRSLSVPLVSPAVFKLSVRILDVKGSREHQDLVLDSSSSRPFLKRIPLPKTHATAAMFSSLLPYKTASGSFMIGIKPSVIIADAGNLGEVPAQWALDVFISQDGSWKKVGTIQTLDYLPEPWGSSLTFSPRFCHAGLVPSAFKNPVSLLKFENHLAEQITL